MLKTLLSISLIFCLAHSSQLVFASSCSDTTKFPKLAQINSRLIDPDYKVLVLGRHGKASAVNKFTAAEREVDPEKVKLDIERPLAKKGKKAAKELAEIFAEMKLRDVGMWGSFAKRVKKTAGYTIKLLGDKVKIKSFEEGLYYVDVPKEMEARLTAVEASGISHAFFGGMVKQLWLYLKS